MDDLTPLEAIVVALAVYRLTLLVVADELTAPLRDRLVMRLNERKHGPRPRMAPGDYDGPTGDVAYTMDREQWRARVAVDPHRLAYLLQCPWCASPYVAAPIVAWTLLGDPGRLSWAVLAVAAASAAAGYLATKASP